ncbi:hypothetical protein KAX02_08000 [candidate division WOR-3 bacterium]|nr:hypothetical protein [candidate division WOR-3 bacterium]
MSAKREDIYDFEIRWKYEVEGWTYKEIADFYGVASSTIYWRLHPEKMKENNDNNKDYMKEYLRVYNQTKREKERKKKWRESDGGKEWLKYYREDHKEEAKEYIKEYSIEYNQTDKRKATIKEYQQSDKGKENSRKSKSKRRELGFIPLNKPFKNSHAHHIDEVHIIYIPAEIHNSIYHNVWTGEGMEDINAIAFGYITEETFDKLIAGEI